MPVGFVVFICLWNMISLVLKYGSYCICQEPLCIIDCDGLVLLLSAGEVQVPNEKKSMNDDKNHHV